MNTGTRTWTETDVRKVFENLQADLQMLATRTQAMDLEHATKCAHDVCLMAVVNCLSRVHIQLYDSKGRLKKAHLYSVEKAVLSDSQRPGGNRWPYIPDGSLRVIVEYSDSQTAEKLKNTGKLLLHWSPSGLAIDYAGMQRESNRLYTSNGYGLQRDTYVS